HQEWEGRVMAMVRAIGANGGINIDMQRFSRESLPPAVYLASSYYKKWLLALAQSMIDRDMIGKDEISAGHSLRQNPALERGKFSVDGVARITTRGSVRREADGRPVLAMG